MGISHHIHANARALTLLVLGGLLSTATSCGLVHSSAPCGHDRNGLPTCPVTVKFIDSQPEAHLLYPGSTVVTSNEGQPQTHDLFAGTTAADIGITAVTPVPMDIVYAWYRTWLTSHGWHSAGNNAPLFGSGLNNEGYVKGTRESFVIQEDSQEGAKSVGPVVPPALQSKTLYDITFLIEPYK
jgi:hypothetical protein